MSTISNAASKPLFFKSGDVPDVSGALQSYYQPMVFEPVGKIVSGYQVAETGNPINFHGVIQPLKPQQLIMKPEGERAWKWFILHADPVLTLSVDDVVKWNGIPTRVMSRTDFALYGYVLYELVQDYTGIGL